MSNWFECHIEYGVIVERLGTPQEAKVIREKRILAADSEPLLRNMISTAIERQSNYIRESLRFLNTHAIPARFS